MYYNALVGSWSWGREKLTAIQGAFHVQHAVETTYNGNIKHMDLSSPSHGV